MKAWKWRDEGGVEVEIVSQLPKNKWVTSIKAGAQIIH